MGLLELPVILIGGGGHAKVLVSTLLLSRKNILGFVDLNQSAAPLLGITCLGKDAAVLLHSPGDVRLVNGIGSTGSTVAHMDVYNRFTQAGYSFATVIHPSSIIAPEVQIEAGVQIMAGAIVQTGCRVGENAILNTGCRVDHDCMIEAHAHVSPGVTLSGGVHVGAGAHIGTGAAIIQRIRVGANSVVGAGSVVIRDVPPGATVAGVPALAMKPKATPQ